MDIGKSFGFVFEDEKWVSKVLIGGLVNLIPIVNLATIGYGLRTLKNVAAGEERPLPNWEDFGDYFVKGLMIFVAVLIYAIPLILLAAMAAVVAAVAGSGGRQDAVTGIFGLCTAALTCVEIVYGLLLVLWFPAAVVKYAASEEFSAFFRFGEIWGFISHNLGGYIVAIIVAWLASLLAGIVGGILCGVGALFTSFWATLVAAHLLGQLQRESAPGPTAPMPTPTA